MNKESIKILQGNLDSLVRKYNILINDNSFNEALNIMKNIDAVTRELQYIGENVITSDITIKNDWYDILKLFVEKKISHRIELEYGNNAEVKHRGTGKTTALFRLSNDYKIPILVKNYEREHIELEKLSKSLGLHIAVVDLKMLNMVQYRKCDVILVDEMTKFDFDVDSQRSRENILNSKVVVGFTNNL
jgi:hypothetical protein